jgi:hypothetical protein
MCQHLFLECEKYRRESAEDKTGERFVRVQTDGTGRTGES